MVISINSITVSRLKISNRMLRHQKDVQSRQLAKRSGKVGISEEREISHDLSITSRAVKGKR